MSGPIGSKYPGTPFMLAAAGLLVIIIAKSAWTAYRLRRDVSTEIPKTNMKQSWEANVFVAAGALLFLVYAVYAIWVHSIAW